METGSRLDLPGSVETCRKRLAQDVLDPEAAGQLQQALGAADFGAPPTAVTRRLQPKLAALWDVCAVLDGGGSWFPVEGSGAAPRALDRALHETLVIHPREKQERQHKLTSLLGRVLHLLEGNEIARAVAGVTRKATAQNFPRLCELHAECARALGIEPPAVHLARGEERLFTVFLDRAPFLCVHPDFTGEGGDTTGLCLSTAEMCFAVGHQLEHVKGGHAALLQISPEVLENLILDQVPFLVRTPIRLASKALGWTRVNLVVKRAGELLPERSRTQRVVNTVGDLLPDKDQETVLPEAVHEWVWGWIQGVEYSADRAGLLLSGSIASSCAAMLCLSPNYAPQVDAIRLRGARRLLQESADVDRPTADRLRELLRFAVSREYLAFVADAGSV